MKATSQQCKFKYFFTPDFKSDSVLASSFRVDATATLMIGNFTLRKYQ
jgi:hypothetical protein